VLQEQSKVTIRPIIHYPKTAEVGRTYLLTVDVRLEGDGVQDWPYEEEEYPITCILETESLFKHETVGNREPVLLLHRFGSTYGPVRFLLTAAAEPRAGQLIVTLVNKFGVPIDFIFLPCEVKAVVSPQERTAQIVLPDLSASPFPLPMPEPPLTHEQQLIEQQLSAAGWTIQTYNPGQLYVDLQIEPENGGLAVRNFDNTEQYVLFVQEVAGPVGIIQVFRVGVPLSGLEQKVTVASLLGRHTETAAGFDILPFVYLSTGYVTRFTNTAETDARSREVFTFHQPQTLSLWSNEILRRPRAPRRGILRKQLRNMLRTHPVQRDGLSEDQYAAISGIEESLSSYHPRSLVCMPSGSGRTAVLVQSISRLMALTATRNILYLVAFPERIQVVERAFETQRRQKIRYSVQSLDTASPLPPARSVVIADIETLYNRQTTRRESGLSITDEAHRTTSAPSFSSEHPLEVTYNPEFPIETFDFIFIDGWSVTLYERWNPLLRYFDAFIIGFSSFVDKDLSALFQKNIVHTSRQSSRRPRMTAVLVGINEYEDRFLPNLIGSNNSVMALSELLTNTVAAQKKIVVLSSATPDMPTRSNILRALQHVSRNAEPDEVVLFYFSGHGARGNHNRSRTESYLIAQDSRWDVLEETALSLSQIREILGTTPAKMALIILDCSYAGAATKEERAEVVSQEFLEHVVEEAGIRPEIAVLASCARDQASVEYSWPGGVQGVFTHFLLEALSGGADVKDRGYVTVNDAYNYVDKKMQEWSRLHRNEQTPAIEASTREHIILSIY
jgi:hypothetical protein